MSPSVQVEPNEIFPKYVFSFQSNFLTKDLADDVVDYLSNLSEDDWYPSDDPSEARGTKNYSMLDLPMLQNLKQEIIFAMESTAQQFFSHDVENLEITNSWAVKVKQNNYLSPHKHANTYFAGTICLSESAVGVQFFDFDFNHTFSLFPATNKKNLRPFMIDALSLASQGRFCFGQVHICMEYLNSQIKKLGILWHLIVRH